MFLMFVWRATLKVSFSPLSFHDQTLLMNSPTISSCYLGLGFQHTIHDELTLCIFAPCLKCGDNHSNIFHLVPRTTTTTNENKKKPQKSSQLLSPWIGFRVCICHSSHHFSSPVLRCLFPPIFLTLDLSPLSAPSLPFSLICVRVSRCVLQFSLNSRSQCVVL